MQRFILQSITASSLWMMFFLYSTTTDLVSFSVDGFSINVVAPNNRMKMATSSNQQYSSQQQLYMGMAQPEVEIKTKVTTATIQKQQQVSKQKIQTSDPISKRKEEFEDAPMYKLMLLADDGYDIEHVITRMCFVMDDMDEDQAKTVLQQAQMSGKAMCGIYPFERAELFKEQLLRSDPMIYADLESEK